MPTEKKFKENLVLVISANGVHRDPILKAMRQEGFQVNFVADISTVTDLIAEMRPGTLVHDWSAVDTSQAISFQQRLGKITEYAGMCRIIYAENITAQLIALASDCGVKRVVSYASSPLALVSEIKMAHAGMKNLSDLQQLIIKAQAGGSYDQKEIDESIEAAFEKFSHDPMVKLEFGNLCLRRSDIPQSKALASELVEAQPQNVRAMNLLARIMMKEGKMNEAIAMLEKANVLSPFNTDRLLMLGDSFFQVGDKSKAASYYNQAAATDPSNVDAQKGLGQVKLSEGDINGALELLKGSASEDESAGFFNNAAVHAAHTGDFQKAYNLYLAATNALKTDKYKPAIFFNIAMTLERLDKIEEAIKYLKRSLKYDPNFTKSQRQMKRLEAILDSRFNNGGKKPA